MVPKRQKYGFFRDLSEIKIQLIDNESMVGPAFECLVDCEQKDFDNRGNFRWVYCIRDLNYQPKAYDYNGWKSSIEFQTDQSFRYERIISTKICDPRGEVKAYKVKGRHPKIIKIFFDEFFKLAEFVNWAHFETYKENLALKKEIEGLKKEIGSMKNSKD